MRADRSSPRDATRQATRETRRQRRLAAERRARQRQLVVSGIAILVMLSGSAYALDQLVGGDGGQGGEGALVAPTPTSRPTAVTPSPSPSPEPTEPPVVLQEPGDFPGDGPGTFRTGTSQGEVLGESGRLLRFRVAVEENLDEDVDEFGDFVEETLADPQGWTAGGDLRFQRVPDGAPSDFTIYLATTGTTDRLCAQGGLRVVAPGLPEGGVSCRVAGQVVLNLHRWRQSVAHFVAQEVPLTVYRQMVLNHEVGHELGLGHEACPEPGGPAPVMQQQTLLLDGCVAWPWPYVDGRRHTGPPVP